MKMQTEEVKRHSRIWRSKEARAVRDALHAHAQSGALRDFSAGKLRLGKMQFTLLCAAGRSYRLLLDIEASMLVLEGLLPVIDEQSSLSKALKSFLKASVSSQSSAQVASCSGATRQGEVRLLSAAKGAALTMQVKNAAYEHCTRHVIDLAEQIRRLFLCDDRQQVFLDRRAVVMSTRGEAGRPCLPP